MTATTTTLRTEAEIDGHIADALDAYFKIQSRVSDAEAYASGKYGAYYADRANEELSGLYVRLAAARDAYNVEAARYGGWSRFYIVLNSNGHVHRNTHCSTCFTTTRFGWLTELSGLTEADAVAEYGSQLCTVCFPSAPVEWTNGSRLGRIAEEARAARLAKKSASNHAKVIKAISDEPRGVLAVIGGGRSRITTTAGARSEIVKILRYLRWGYEHYANGAAEAQVIAELLAARLAELAERFPADEIKVETAEQIIAKATKTAAKD